MTEGLFALLGTIFAGVGLKVFDFFVQKRAEKRAAAKALADAALAEESARIGELKEEITRIRNELDDTIKEMLEWRDKYWSLREEHLTKMEELYELLRGVSKNGNV